MQLMNKNNEGLKRYNQDANILFSANLIFGDFL